MNIDLLVAIRSLQMLSRKSQNRRLSTAGCLLSAPSDEDLYDKRRANDHNEHATDGNDTDHVMAATTRCRLDAYFLAVVFSVTCDRRGRLQSLQTRSAQYTNRTEWNPCKCRHSSCRRFRVCVMPVTLVLVIISGVVIDLAYTHSTLAQSTILRSR